MRLLILGEIDEDLASVRIRNLLREINEKLMRAALEIHGYVQRVDIARLVLHFDLQQFLLRKNLFDNFPAERQPRRFSLQPVVFLEKRSVFNLEPPQVIGFFRREPLKHQPATAVFGFPRGVRVEGVPAPFDRKGQFQRVPNDSRFQALPLIQRFRFLLPAKACFADSEDGIPAVALFKLMLTGRAADQTFDSARWKLHRRSADVADEMQVIRLADEWLVSRHSAQFGLTDESGLQQEFNRPVNRRKPDPVPLRQQVVADFFNRRMPLRLEKRGPDEGSLRRLLKFPFGKELLELFALCHRGIIRYS